MNRRPYSALFYKYFLSFFSLVLVVVLVSGIFIYTNLIRELEKEVERTCFIHLDHLRENMNTRMREMDNISYQISSVSKYSPYRLKEHLISRMEAIDNLTLFQSTNSFIEQIMIYYKEPLSKIGIEVIFLTGIGRISHC